MVRISYVHNQIKKLCLSIEYIGNQTSKMCYKAVTDSKESFKFARNKNFNICKYAITLTDYRQKSKDHLFKILYNNKGRHLEINIELIVHEYNNECEDDEVKYEIDHYSDASYENDFSKEIYELYPRYKARWVWRNKIY